MKIIEDLGQILVVLHTLLVIIETTPRLNKQSGSDKSLLFIKTINKLIRLSITRLLRPVIPLDFLIYKFYYFCVMCLWFD